LEMPRKEIIADDIMVPESFDLTSSPQPDGFPLSPRERGRGVP
jgi:hypothetical protein